jgi:hypothetical protein
MATSHFLQSGVATIFKNPVNMKDENEDVDVEGAKINWKNKNV